MRSLRIALIIGVASMTLSSSVFAQQVEPNAFINKYCLTIESLVAHASTDSEVMSRYTRHFGMTREEVIAYLKTLHRGTIKEDGAYLIYNTPESGEIRARVMHYKKGTTVWVDDSGNYVLKVSCGNPMVRGTDMASSEEPETQAMKTMTDVRELVAEQPPGIGSDELTGTTIVPAIPEMSAITIDDVPPANPFEGGAQIIIPAAILVPFTAGVLVNSGSAPVPEPASMIALGSGVALLIARRRKKKSA